MNSNYEDPKLFGGLKNDEDPKQISDEYFIDMKNFDYPDTGILGINKILMPELVSIFLSPDLELNITDNITVSGDNITSSFSSPPYLWDDPSFKYDLSEWG